jgi:hypothetical protein
VCRVWKAAEVSLGCNRLQNESVRRAACVDRRTSQKQEVAFALSQRGDFSGLELKFRPLALSANSTSFLPSLHLTSFRTSPLTPQPTPCNPLPQIDISAYALFASAAISLQNFPQSKAGSGSLLNLEIVWRTLWGCIDGGALYGSAGGGGARSALVVEVQSPLAQLCILALRRWCW